jgi:hypothetical protein
MRSAPWSRSLASDPALGNESIDDRVPIPCGLPHGNSVSLGLRDRGD